LRLPWRSLLQLLALSALFWAVAAALLASAMPGLGGFGRLLLIVECVGIAMVAIATLLTRRLGPQRLSRPWLLVLAWLPAVPLGYVLGHIVAFTLLGEPVAVLGSGRDRMVPILFTLISAALGFLYFSGRDRLAHERAEHAQAQALAAQTELRLLRAQLEPHMLFNTLANLRSLIDEGSPQALPMTDQLIAYLRGVLAASRTDSSTLHAEFAQLRAYLDIMRLRMGARLSYELDLPKEVQQTALPAMLLQPLVENAIRHGLEPRVGAGRLVVRARRVGDDVEIAVSDTGGGLDAAAAPERGYGLQHVRERLARAYGPRARLTLSAEPGGGARAVVCIPS
jgi:hypothetical protein